MPEESTPPDLVELVNRVREAVNGRDFDAIERFYTPDVVLRGEMIGIFEGRTAVRGFWEDVYSPYEQLHGEAEQIVDLGFGVAFLVTVAKGRLIGSGSDVRLRYASVLVWTEGLIEEMTNYMDVDEARAAGEHVAQERSEAN